MDTFNSKMVVHKHKVLLFVKQPCRKNPIEQYRGFFDIYRELKKNRLRILTSKIGTNFLVLRQLPYGPWLSLCCII